MTDIEYGILDECKCGREEFFVLVSSVEYNKPRELRAFLEALVRLVDAGLLCCGRYGVEGDIRPDLSDLMTYVDKRLATGEDLEEYPHTEPEYYFATTEKGIQCLREEDRPVSLEGGD